MKFIDFSGYLINLDHIRTYHTGHEPERKEERDGQRYTPYEAPYWTIHLLFPDKGGGYSQQFQDEEEFKAKDKEIRDILLGRDDVTRLSAADEEDIRAHDPALLP